MRVVYARFTGRLPAPPLHAGGGGGDDGLAESRIDKPAAGNRDCGGCCSRANVNGHGRLRSTESPLRWVAPILYSCTHAPSVAVRTPSRRRLGRPKRPARRRSVAFDRVRSGSKECNVVVTHHPSPIHSTHAITAWVHWGGRPRVGAVVGRSRANLFWIMVAPPRVSHAKFDEMPFAFAYDIGSITITVEN